MSAAVVAATSVAAIRARECRGDSVANRAALVGGTLSAPFVALQLGWYAWRNRAMFAASQYGAGQ